MGVMAPEATADPQPATTVFAIGKCVDPSQPAQQRPTRFDYNCDGTGVMQDMTWTSWGVDGAKGTGTDASIWCQPNCAQGPLLTNPIIVHAWNPLPPSSTGCPPDVKFYSDLTIAYPEGVPPWIIPGTSWDDGTDLRDHRRQARGSLLRPDPELLAAVIRVFVILVTIAG